MTVNVYTVPIIVHVVGTSPEDAIERLHQAGRNVTDAGPVTLKARHGGEVTVLYINFPDGPDDWDGTQLGYTLEPGDPAHDEAVETALPEVTA